MTVNPNKAIEFLLARGNLPILYWLKKDILEVPIDREHRNLQKFASRIRILKSQRPNGAWCRKKYEGHPRWEKTHYIVETLRNISRLYDFGCAMEDEGVPKAVEFLFSTQTQEGDFRGAYLNEYAPTYHALTLEILCRYGLDKDKRVQKGFRWILRSRQDDGGWVIPYRTINKEELKKRYNFEAQLKLKPVKPDKSKPFSHLVTGMVLRAFAESPTWRKSKGAREAGELLLNRFFKEDKYDDRREAFFWEEITYPFWATDILSSLDSLSKIGFSPESGKIQHALQWLLSKQNNQGFWESIHRKSTLESHLWMTMAVLRVLKRFGLLNL
ncbi:MAG: prenyltransferase/squalene oxidase repeat-containing protein [Candidatus Aminicenantaceae bacterium]